MQLECENTDLWSGFLTFRQMRSNHRSKNMRFPVLSFVTLIYEIKILSLETEKRCSPQPVL
jgi:hypothetical protein